MGDVRSLVRMISEHMIVSACTIHACAVVPIEIQLLQHKNVIFDFFKVLLFLSSCHHHRRSTNLGYVELNAYIHV